MSATKPTTSQIRFTSRYTGEHLLDTYLEAMEKGGRSVPDILDDLFSDDGNLIANVDMRFNTQTLFVEYRHGVFVDSEAGWQPVAKFKFWQNKGEYTPGTAYEIHDIVTHNENWLICTEAHTGTDPIVGLYWDTLFNADYIKSVQADVTSKLNDTETKRAEVEANQQDVATRQTDIITRQADITTRQTTITAIQSDVTAKQTDVTTKHGEVETNRQDVETRQTDIIARQSDITTKQTDITTKHTQVEADRAEVETR
uniref:hypothetical protein n=1 Tax=Endozoicomonas atrinae TaxID=1333660 RepID=UPI001112CFE5